MWLDVGGSSVDLRVSKTLAASAKHRFSENCSALQIIKANQDIVAAELFNCTLP